MLGFGTIPGAIAAIALLDVVGPMAAEAAANIGRPARRRWTTWR
jgi:hypothetical protein